MRVHAGQAPQGRIGRVSKAVTSLRSTDELLAELFEFLRIPSVSSGDGDPADLRRAAEWLCARIREAGGAAAVQPTVRNPLAVGTIVCDRPDAPHVLVYGHYDVQTVAPLADWESPPFEPEVRDGYIYARGASDDKGNFHAVLAPLLDMARAGELPVDVTIVCDGEEEIGGDSVARWLEATPTRYDACVVFDGAFVAPGRPALTTGTRGIVQGHARIRTGRRDVHSGLYGGAGLNAAHVAAALIAGTMARDGSLPEALEAGTAPPSPAERESWGTLPDGAAELRDAGIAALDGGAAAAYYERTLARPTFDVNAVTCRDASQRRTIIPVEADVSFSLRVAYGQDPAAVWQALERHWGELTPPGASVDLALHAAAGPSWFDPALPALALARAAIEEATGAECALVRTGGAIPLLPALERRGIPAVLTGVALPEDNVHAPNERLGLDRYELGVRMGAAILRALGDLPRANGEEREHREERLDDAIEQTFPASDPISTWRGEPD
jgi:acetylornithine deacetylase/succinyl-diaminopimelate desuccinylase-like protein